MSAPHEIATWLGQIGLPEYVPIFAEHAIDGEVLADLDDQDLRELGVPLGHRKRLLKAIAALREPADQTAGQREAGTSEAPPREAERRQLTVLFCDLVGSTALAARLDPEDMGRVIRAYQQCCAEVIERWGGHVAKYMGDGVLAYFGWPQAHEDDAERAVRAGLALTGAVGKVVTPAGASLAARVGIATGLVMVGELIGEGAAKEQAVVGDTPNLAARLQALASPSSVVISQATRRLLGGVFELDDLGPRRLKGFAERLAAWRVKGEGQAEGRFEARQTAGLTPLVGRDEEIALLLRRWQQVKDGEGHVVLLSGEPGIGKSRLVREVRARLEGEPHVRLLYQCSPHHTTSPLHPLIEQLERAARFAAGDRAEEKLDKLAALLARGTDRLDQAVPLIAALLGLPTEDRPALPELTPDRRKQLTLEALVDQLEGLAAVQPVLLAYEDVHWSDPTTQELLGLTIERIQRLPVLALITFRPEFTPPWSGQSHVSALALSRLGRREGAAMVERVVRDKALPAEVAAQIVAKTDGVPLFVEELTKTVLESGLLKDAGERYELSGPLPPLAIPSTLHDSLLARLAPVKQIAQIGAAIGREFSHALLAAVTDRPEPELRAALDQLVSSELVYRSGSPPEATYSFKHALIQDAAYQSLLRSRRQQLHARVATALELHFPITVETQPEILAHHFTEAALFDRAIAYWQRAGQVAVQRSAMAEAVEDYRNALDAMAKLPEDLTRDRRELDLLLEAGLPTIAHHGYAHEAVERIYARARELHSTTGDRSTRFAISRGLWNCYLVRGEILRSLKIGEEVRALALRLDQRVKALADRSVGSTLFFLGRFRKAFESCEAGLLECQADPDTTALKVFGEDPGLNCRLYRAYSSWFLGFPDQAVSDVQVATDWARSLGNPHGLANALCFAAQIHQYRREPRDTVEIAKQAISISMKYDLPQWRALSTILAGWGAALCAGEVSSRHEIESGLAAWRSTGARLNSTYYPALLAEVYDVLGHPDDALREIDITLQSLPPGEEAYFLAELRRLRGELLLRSGRVDPGEAQDELAAALKIAEAQGARSLQLRAATSLARLWASQGERQQARDLLAPIYGWFTEGFDTADLKDAKALLDEVR